MDINVKKTTKEILRNSVRFFIIEYVLSVKGKIIMESNLVEA